MLAYSSHITLESQKHSNKATETTRSAWKRKQSSQINFNVWAIAVLQTNNESLFKGFQASLVKCWANSFRETLYWVAKCKQKF